MIKFYFLIYYLLDQQIFITTKITFLFLHNYIFEILIITKIIFIFIFNNTIYLHLSYLVYCIF